MIGIDEQSLRRYMRELYATMHRDIYPSFDTMYAFAALHYQYLQDIGQGASDDARIHTALVVVEQELGSYVGFLADFPGVEVVYDSAEFADDFIAEKFV